MSQKNRKLYISLILLSFVSLNYLAVFGWWISALASFLIIYFSHLCWPSNYKNRLGIDIDVRQYFFAFIIGLILLPSCLLLIFHIANENNLHIATSHPFNFVHILFYTLNEEMILGGLFLYVLKNRYQKLQPLYISVIVAVFFAVLHYMSYRWIFQDPAQGILSLSTMASLLMIGIIRNNLILKTGHIAYAWVLHSCWMAIMFGYVFYSTEKQQVLPEAQRFNTFLGNELTVYIILILTLLITLWFLKENFRRKKYSP